MNWLERAAGNIIKFTPVDIVGWALSIGVLIVMVAFMWLLVSKHRANSSYDDFTLIDTVTTYRHGPDKKRYLDTNKLIVMALFLITTYGFLYVLQTYKDLIVWYSMNYFGWWIAYATHGRYKSVEMAKASLGLETTSTTKVITTPSVVTEEKTTTEIPHKEKTP